MTGIPPPLPNRHRPEIDSPPRLPSEVLKGKQDELSSRGTSPASALVLSLVCVVLLSILIFIAAALYRNTFSSLGERIATTHESTQVPTTENIGVGDFNFASEDSEEESKVGEQPVSSTPPDQQPDDTTHSMEDSDSRKSDNGIEADDKPLVEEGISEQPSEQEIKTKELGDAVGVSTEMTEEQANNSNAPAALSKPIRVLNVGPEQAVLDNETNHEKDNSPSGGFLPRGANAVSKGSFTVWTVPKNPRPLQDYRIVIEINLPQEVKGYYPRDLSGVVVGTDSYRQTLPFSPGTVTRQSGSTRALSKFKRITVRKHKVQFLVPVPGAVRLVRDRITLRSKLLKEEHSLELVFNGH